METVIGQAAQGSNFYNRPREIRLITESLLAGNNLQIAAPRRIGKTSILMHFQDKPIEGFIFVYIDVERVDSEEGYYKKIYQEILRNDSISKSKRIYEQVKNKANKFLRNIKGITILDGELEFREGEQVSYYDELNNFLSGLDLEGNKLVIMVDEFPEVIINIHSEIKENNPKVIQFLQSNRTLRNTDYIKKNVIFILTGSNSLNITVAGFGASKLINDLNPIPVSPLRETEAKDLITQIFAHYKHAISEESLKYLVNKIELLFPSYCQLMVQEIRLLIDKDEEITTAIIDRAFENIINLRNHAFFEDYQSRLRRLLKEDDYKFASELLALIATQNTLQEDKVFDLSQKYKLQKHWRNYILESLIFDGYLAQHGEQLMFHSPILKTWWKRYGN